jgi:hypothetical protein
MDLDSTPSGDPYRPGGVVSRISALAQAVGDAWRPFGYEENALPECAASALRDSGILDRVNSSEVVNWLMRADSLPPQDKYEFGQPDIIVHNEARFYIQVLYWIDGTTTIHQHAFSGAFGVLLGSSLHTTYAFDPAEPASAPIVPGQLNFLGSELLKRGDVRPIVAGQLIHSLFHLERPSISLVIRTPGNSVRRQYDYHPSLAVDPFHAPRLPLIQLRMLESLQRTNSPEFWTAAEACIQTSSRWVLYKALAIAFRTRDQEANWQHFLTGATKKHGSIVAHVVRCIEGQARTNRVYALREQVHDATHRYLIALLLNLPHREAVYQKITERFPGSDPEALALRWLGEIFSVSRAGLKLTPMTVHLLRVALHAPDFESVRRELGSYIRSDREEQDEETLRSTWTKLLNVDLFQPLFSREPAAGDRPSSVNLDVVRERAAQFTAAH